MTDITEIDHNFKYESKLALEDAFFFNVKEHPCYLFGLQSDTLFRRMPQDVARKVNDGVYALHTNTSGGRVRLVTNSPYVAICAVLPDRTAFSHMPGTGVCGFDLYAGGKFVANFIPPLDLSEGYERIYRFSDAWERQITIHFPLYNNVKELYIGLQKGSSLKEDTSLKASRKIVYYGSSITQGGCVSRPGLAYPTIVSERLNCDFINLGFSGSAKGEPIMAEYIAELNPDIFIMDYDHNAPTKEFLEATHENFFRTFRQLQKTTPVVLMSAPNVRFSLESWIKRRDVVYRTYQNAVQSGDQNVYFLDGMDLWGRKDWEMCTVDAIHPNDLGHYRMAQRLIALLGKIGEPMP